MAQSTNWRPQPPSINDPVQGEFEGEELGQESDTVGMEIGDTPSNENEPKKPNWIKRAKDSYRFSTSYIDSNYRVKWDDSIRAFNNQHPADSKYNSEMFRKRSNLFRPKTRAVIRKNEAAAAAAFFSNMDLIDVAASNQQDRAELVSAEVTKQLLQYRLTKTIPWFQIVMGGIQDGQTQGAACAHVYWRFMERHDDEGNQESLEDKPCIDLIPIENLRIDPSASWLDPVGTSPYIIHLIPMYWCDVKERMEYPNPKGQKWKKYGPSIVFAKSENQDDSTRQARNQLSQDPTQQRRDVSDYDIVWIHRHIHKWNGEDWEFYTVNSERLLTEPEPLKNTVWHGHRPYVMGNVILETHKPMPTSLPTLIKPLQEEANTIQNQRMDNVQFVLNKRWFAKRGKNIDLASLVRNVPGGITLVDDPEADIKEVTWPDVTSSAYLEQDRIDGDFSDLVGNFNPMQVQSQRTGRESTNTMRMLQGPTNLLTEYMLKTYVETFITPILRQLVMLEQHYETDMVVLALAGQKAEVFKKYGVSQVSDAVLNKEVNVTINVGMGATDPTAKLQRFVYAVDNFAKVARLAPPGIDMKEVWKEYCALSGYQDGARFIIDGQDPTVAGLQKQLQAMQMALQKGPAAQAQAKQQVAQEKKEANEVKVLTTHETNQTKLKIAGLQDDTKKRVELLKHVAGADQKQTERQGAVEDRNFGAVQQQQERLQEPAVPEKNAEMESVKEFLKVMGKGQMELARSVSELASSIHEEHEGKKHEKPKPKVKKGRAILPSGGEMQFEMTES